MTRGCASWRGPPAGGLKIVRSSGAVLAMGEGLVPAAAGAMHAIFLELGLDLEKAAQGSCGEPAA